jgi:hypothetical protein
MTMNTNELPEPISIEEGTIKVISEERLQATTPLNVPPIIEIEETPEERLARIKSYNKKPKPKRVHEVEHTKEDGVINEDLWDE